MNARLVPRLVSALLTAFAMVSLAVPAGAADTITEARTVGAFDHIRFEGAFTAEISAGAPRTQVEVSASRSVLDRVTTAVHDGTLVVGMRTGGGFFDGTPHLTIEVPVLRGFANSGAGKVTIAGLTGSDVAISNAGAASIRAAGRAANLSIELDGTGKIDARDLAAHDVTVDNNGVGAVYVRASGSLAMSVNGVGEIRYAGNPSHVEQHVNGIGSINHL